MTQLLFKTEEQIAPTAELMHYQLKEIYPAFAVLENAATLMPEDDDYYFTYDKNGYCHGGYFASIDYARGFGTTKEVTNKEGFANGDKMYLGFYDSSEDKYYNLITDKELTYKSLGLYRVVVVKGDEIGLNIHQDLLTPELEFQHVPDRYDVYKDSNLFFEVEHENLKDVSIELVKGKGTLQIVDRWINNHSVNVQYSGVQDDTQVEFKIKGTTIFTGEEIEKVLTIDVTNSSQVPPPAEEVLFANEYFDVFVSEMFVYLRALTTVPVYVNFKVNSGNMTKYLVTSKGTKPGDTKLITTTTGLESFAVNWAMYKGIDGLPSYKWTGKDNINQILI